MTEPDPKDRAPRVPLGLPAEPPVWQGAAVPMTAPTPPVWLAPPIEPPVWERAATAAAAPYPPPIWLAPLPSVAHLPEAAVPPVSRLLSSRQCTDCRARQSTTQCEDCLRIEREIDEKIRMALRDQFSAKPF